MWQAARHGNLEQMQALFRQNPNRRVFFNRLDPETKLTPLHYAARFHHLDVCRYLIEQCEADLNKPGEDGMTPLHYLARFRAEKESQVGLVGRRDQLLFARSCLRLDGLVRKSPPISDSLPSGYQRTRRLCCDVSLRCLLTRVDFSRRAETRSVGCEARGYSLRI